MTDSDPEQAQQEDHSSPTSTQTTDKQEVRQSGALSGRLALILSVIALIASGYIWYTLFYVKQDLLQTDIAGTAQRLNNEVGNIREEFATTSAEITSLRDTQDTLKDAINKVNNELGRNRAEWVLAETEQLLLIANHRLQLARDISTALSALRAADRHLHNLADPALLPVRKILLQEISQLESLGQPDVPGIALRLGTLANTVAELPLAVDTLFQRAEIQIQQDGNTNDADEPLTRQIWNDLRRLVRIQNNVQVQKPLLPPEQHYFLRQNLRLMLTGAQLALMQNDVDTYKQNITFAKQWINDYFDTNTQVVQHTDHELDRLLKENVVIDLPDISASLEALRKIASRKTGS